MTNWKDKKVFVTGAGGFIGSHLVERLVREGARVRAFVRYNSRNHWGNLEFLSPEILDAVEVAAGDLTDPFSVDSAVRGTEIVFHLGALIAIPYSYVAPWQFVATNVQGTVNVLEACRKYGVSRMVHTSTSETYGTAVYTPIDEAHPQQAQSPYSASKISADRMAESYFRSFGLPVATIRPFNTYGPRQSARAVIPTIISQALTGQQIRLGALDPIRDLTYVEDTVEGFLAVAKAENSVGEVINIGTGQGISIGRLAGLIVDTMRKGKAEVQSDMQRVRPENSEVYELICENRRAREICGWEPRVSLKEGLKRTIDWIEKNLGNFKPNIYNI